MRIRVHSDFLTHPVLIKNNAPEGGQKQKTTPEKTPQNHDVSISLSSTKIFEAVNAGQKTKSFQNKLKANSCSQRFLDTSCFDQKQRPRGRPETKKQHQRKRHKIMTCLYHCLPQKCFEAVNAGKKANRNKNPPQPKRHIRLKNTVGRSRPYKMGKAPSPKREKTQSVVKDWLH